MAKKLPLLTLSLLTLTTAASSFYLAPSASASIFAPNGEKVWTLEEVMAGATEIENVLAAECPDDISCQGRIYSEYTAANGLYNGVQYFHNRSFLVTSINPSAETIKILFHTKKTTFGNFTPREDTITEARIVWTDEGSPDIVNTYGGMIPDALPDWAHWVYNASRSTQGPDWFPSYTEFEVFVPEADLDLNTNGIMSYTFYSTYSNARGKVNYTNCLNSPYYEPGMECHLVFKDINGTVDYVPYLDGRPAYPDSGYVEPIMEPESSGLGSEDSPNIEDPAAIAPAKLTTTEAIQAPKTPETGAQAYPTEVCSREINLPWWIIVLILAGNALLIWWFTPNRQKSRKNAKKSQKKVLTRLAVFDKMVSV